MHKRLRILCIRAGGLLGAGLFYAVLCFLAKRPLIPCLFHTVTGLYCPGCGISRMCLALLQLDFEAAFKANAAVLLLLPAAFIIGLQMAVRYVREGQTQPTHTQSVILGFMTLVLIIFCIFRNLPLLLQAFSLSL